VRIAIEHEIAVAVPPGVARTQLHLLVQPRETRSQTIASWAVDCEDIETAARFGDGFGNDAVLVTRRRPEDSVRVRITGMVETRDTSGVIGRQPGEPVPALYRRVTPLTRSNVTLFGKFRHAPRDGQERIALLHALMDRVGEFLVFAPDGTLEAAEDEPAPTQSQSQTMGTMSQSQSQGQTSTLKRSPGTARDFAHAFIGAARALDIPARYVTGYLLEGEVPFHAWAEAWDDGLGWIAFDPALALCPTDRHVRLAVGLDAVSATPLRASPTEGEFETVAVSVSAA
jgi:transglutaminase-like putative cysteine protease